LQLIVPWFDLDAAASGSGAMTLAADFSADAQQSRSSSCRHPAARCGLTRLGISVERFFSASRKSGAFGLILVGRLLQEFDFPAA